jgi:phosphoribosylanthranilate isomerase
VLPEGIVVSVKFCGLTRRDDAAQAATLGASHVGAIFAGGPRNLTPDQAALVLDGASTVQARVGVFGVDAIDRILNTVETARLDIVQLHGDPRASDIRAIRAKFSGKIWAVARAEGSLLPEWADELFREADAVLLDARVSGKLGGTGVVLEWGALARSVNDLRGDAMLVLAGGLHPGNVAEAVRLLAPAVVDVSSGVESAPGIKDHGKMRAFLEAAQGAAQ